MKKILFIFATVLLVSTMLVSCSKDEDNGYSIVGVWKGSIYYRFTNNSEWYEYGSDAAYERGHYRDNGKYTFDGTFLSLDGDFKYEVVFSEDGQKMKWRGIVYKRVK